MAKAEAQKLNRMRSPGRRHLLFACLLTSLGLSWGTPINAQAARELPSDKTSSPFPNQRYVPFASHQSAARFQLSQRDDRDAADSRRARWEKLSPKQRERIKRGHERYEALPPEDKEKVKDALRRYREMPPEERRRLKHKWRERAAKQQQ